MTLLSCPETSGQEGHCKEILCHLFPTTDLVAQPKRNIFYSLKQHQQELVEALVVPDKQSKPKEKQKDSEN